MCNEGFSSYWFLQHNIYFLRTCALGQEIRQGGLPGTGKGWRTDRETTTRGWGKRPKHAEESAVLPPKGLRAWRKKHSLLSLCTAFELSENYFLADTHDSRVDKYSDLTCFNWKVGRITRTPFPRVWGKWDEWSQSALALINTGSDWGGSGKCRPSAYQGQGGATPSWALLYIGAPRNHIN